MTPPARPTQRIVLEELSRSVAVPGLSPFPTLLAHVTEALFTGPAAARQPLTQAIRAQLRRRDVAVLAPLLGGWPREVCPATAGASLRQELDLVAALDPDALAEQIALAEGMGRPTERWREVHRQPGRWLEGYAQALGRAWPLVEPLWHASSGMLDREVERCAVALARGTTGELLLSLHVGSHVMEGQWHLPSHSRSAAALAAADRIELIPVVAPPTAEGWRDDDDDCLSGVVYSAPRWWRAFDREAGGPESLEALLGPQRARLLSGLDTPQAAGALAELLFTVRSAVTHHVQILEASGLVERSARGRQVIVTRTARGTELLNLYSGRP